MFQDSRISALEKEVQSVEDKIMTLQEEGSVHFDRKDKDSISSREKTLKAEVNISREKTRKSAVNISREKTLKSAVNISREKTLKAEVNISREKTLKAEVNISREKTT